MDPLKVAARVTADAAIVSFCIMEKRRYDVSNSFRLRPPLLIKGHPVAQSELPWRHRDISLRRQPIVVKLLEAWRLNHAAMMSRRFNMEGKLGYYIGVVTDATSLMGVVDGVSDPGTGLVLWGFGIVGTCGCCGCYCDFCYAVDIGVVVVVDAFSVVIIGLIVVEAAAFPFLVAVVLLLVLMSLWLPFWLLFSWLT